MTHTNVGPLRLAVGALTGHDTTAPDPTVTAQAITRMLQVTA